MKSLLNFLHKRPKKKSKFQRLQEIKSQKIILTKKVRLDVDSDIDVVLQYMNKLGIDVKDKSVSQIEIQIDQLIVQSMSITVNSCPDDAKVKNMGDKFLESLDNRNLLMLKYHVKTLKAWLESE